MEDKIKELQEEIARLKIDNEKLNGMRMKSKEYYEKNKEECKRKAREYKKRINYKHEPTKEQKKEYNRNAYLRRKEKMKKALEEEKKDDI